MNSRDGNPSPDLESGALAELGYLSTRTTGLCPRFSRLLGTGSFGNPRTAARALVTGGREVRGGNGRAYDPSWSPDHRARVSSAIRSPCVVKK